MEVGKEGKTEEKQGRGEEGIKEKEEEEERRRIRER